MCMQLPDLDRFVQYAAQCVSDERCLGHSEAGLQRSGRQRQHLAGSGGAHERKFVAQLAAKVSNLGQWHVTQEPRNRPVKSVC